MDPHVTQRFNAFGHSAKQRGNIALPDADAVALREVMGSPPIALIGHSHSIPEAQSTSEERTVAPPLRRHSDLSNPVKW
ncbi:MAG: hypothetical protein FWD74_00995 [Actinomycetia bacterium]|nr:hypothetical protein [Actinomycetes bacterium]